MKIAGGGEKNVRDEAAEIGFMKGWGGLTMEMKIKEVVWMQSF